MRDQSPQGLPGGAAAAYVDVLEGIFVLSVYLEHSEGWSEDEPRIIHRVAEWLATATAPWVLCGDFNVEPD
eukprot:11199724-Lingulodinium_polyedra.AAC.1